MLTNVNKLLKKLQIQFICVSSLKTIDRQLLYILTSRQKEERNLWPIIERDYYTLFTFN